MWKGTAETLNARPAQMKTRPTIRPRLGSVSGAAKISASDSKLVVPEKP